MLNILITGVGGPTPRSFSIALKKYSSLKNIRLIGTDINPLAVGLYNTELYAKTYITPKSTEPDYWEFIEKIVKEESIDFALIFPESEVLTWAHNKEKWPCPSYVPDKTLASSLVDKAKMTEWLEPYGFVPKSMEFDRDQTDFDQIFNKLGDSFWVRSVSGTSGLGSLLIDSEQALKNWININPNIQRFLGSTYLPGRNLACKMLYWEGELLRTACAERVNYIMAKVSPSGITGNTSFGRLLNEPEVVKLASDAMDKMFEATSSPKHGFFTVDLKEDSHGTPFITEVNVRHVAFTQCFAAGGANFAEDTIRLMSGDRSFEKNYCMYEFESGLIFLRDVDALPIIMNEVDLLH